MGQSRFSQRCPIVKSSLQPWQDLTRSMGTPSSSGMLYVSRRYCCSSAMERGDKVYHPVGESSSQPSVTNARSASSASFIERPAVLVVACCVAACCVEDDGPASGSEPPPPPPPPDSSWEGRGRRRRSPGRGLCSFTASMDRTAQSSSRGVLFVSNMQSRRRRKNAISSAEWVVATCTSESDVMLVST